VFPVKLYHNIIITSIITERLAWMKLDLARTELLGGFFETYLKLNHSTQGDGSFGLTQGDGSFVLLFSPTWFGIYIRSEKMPRTAIKKSSTGI
jgi:hypothetical protein